MAPVSPSFCTGTLYLFTVSLFYFYSCANIIAKLTLKAKHWQLYKIN